MERDRSEFETQLILDELDGEVTHHELLDFFEGNDGHVFADIDSVHDLALEDCDIGILKIIKLPDFCHDLILVIMDECLVLRFIHTS